MFKLGRAAPVRLALSLVAWVGLSLCAGIVGSQFPPGEWYAALAKPTWTPPDWIFAPVWTTLYVLMGVAAWLVWRRGGLGAQRGPLALFLVQLALNATWSWLFFGLRQPGAALVEILVLWAMILLTLMAFVKVNRTAGWLMAPYLGWVSYATALNVALWRLNP